MIVNLEDRMVCKIEVEGESPCVRKGHSSVVISFDFVNKLFLLGGQNNEFCQMNIFYLRQKFKSEKNLICEEIIRDENQLMSEEMANNFIFEKTRRIGKIKDIIIFEKTKQAGLMKEKNLIEKDKSDLETDFKSVISDYNEKLENLKKKNESVQQNNKQTVKLMETERKRENVRFEKTKLIQDYLYRLFLYPKILNKVLEENVNNKNSDLKKTKGFNSLAKEYLPAIKTSKEKLQVIFMSFAKACSENREVEEKLQNEIKMEEEKIMKRFQTFSALKN